MKKHTRTFVQMLVAMAMTLICCNLSAASNKPLTKTQVAQGKIEGFLEGNHAVYYGIPYALPPVGELRWKAPVPAKAWKGTLKATKPKAAPMQPKNPGDPRKFDISEDCLYLNIWTPAQRAGENLPVMVWIHGGGFITGTAMINPKHLVDRGVVVVSIEYRTGALGFLALPELSAESPTHTSGNYGLMDQILGLKWVKNNIAAFGGNPDKVTIFGESAGAISVSMLCGSPMARGLFQGAISESGGNFCPTDSVRFNNDGNRDMKGAEAHGLNFMHRMGANSLAEMRKIDAAKLVNDPATTGVGGFWPCVDNVVLCDQYKLYEQGKFNDVNVIVGTNSDEGTMFVRPVKVADYEAQVRKVYGRWADRVLQLYPAATEEETFYAQADQFRETAFAWPSFAWERLQQEHGHANVFVYYFDQMQPYCFGGPKFKARGAGHGTDMDYVFGEPLFLQPLTGKAKELSEKMITYWTNFAKYGNPNGDGSDNSLLTWPLYNQDKTTVMHFKDNKCDIIAVPNREKLEFWQDYYQWKRDNWKDR